jgi:hypothetical protein
MNTPGRSSSTRKTSARPETRQIPPIRIVIMSEPRHTPRPVNLHHLRGLAFQDWGVTDFRELANMLEDPLVFVNGHWREWVCFLGDQQDADEGDTKHPHVLVIGKALPGDDTKSHSPPAIEYLLDRDLEDDEGQWGPEPQHLERMRALGILPKWVEEQELGWWDQMLKDQQ